MTNIKYPPQHSMEYEKAILSLLMDPTKLIHEKAEVFDSLMETDFHHERHKIIFAACFKLHREKKPIDAITTTEETDGKFEYNGSYISEITDCLPATSTEHFSEVLRNYSKMREASRLLQKYMKVLHAVPRPQDVADVLDEIQKDFVCIDARGRDSFLTAASLMKANLDQYRKMNKGDDHTTIATGLHELDDIISLKGPKLVIIAARPSVGKSAMAGCILRHMGINGEPGAIFEMEMDKQDLMNRWISQMTGIPLTRLTFGTGPGPGDWQPIMDAGGKIHEWPVLIDDEGGLTISELRRRARVAWKKGAKAIFIDQLSQMRGPGKTEYEKNTNILQELSRLKKELSIPVFLLCQIGRKQFENKDNRPRLHHLKTTGAIEEEADIVLLMDRPYLYTDDEADKHKAIIDVAKQRGGPIGAVEVEWRGATTDFRNRRM